MDEYDVPVAKANSNGYYREMLDVMKGLLQALKDNQAIRFAVITGCLKIAKESIFTGTNNFVSDTITDSRRMNISDLCRMRWTGSLKMLGQKNIRKV